ncbi:hypothetical protein HNY73_003218 [Argiope bruennichi]|uniref:Uncharacterized protein n=1 Tax=Argiope bruennichi TaxID=94029 RepID=A0A8T0FW73_ARGBR|nr:hypothetical protein HNY73_003218 [Argiope bruennichi]
MILIFFNPKVKSGDTKEAPIKSYLEQLLTFVAFKESVCLIINKIAQMKKEIQVDFEIGYSLQECEELMHQQNNLEFQCAASIIFFHAIFRWKRTNEKWFVMFIEETRYLRLLSLMDIYGKYSSLKNEASVALKEKNFLSKQISEYSKILDDSSQSLATAIGRRRDLLSASTEFHRLLFEFRGKAQEIRDFVSHFDNNHGFQREMKFYIQKIQVFIDEICYISVTVLSQGLHLLQVLTKLNLSGTTREKHRHHVGGWLAFVEVEREFRLMELNRLSIKIHLMWQLQRCNLGIRQAIQWLKDLIQSMLVRSEEIGETAEEADNLFLLHIRFQEAGKKSYQIGVQLTEIEDGL